MGNGKAQFHLEIVKPSFGKSKTQLFFPVFFQCIICITCVSYEVYSELKTTDSGMVTSRHTADFRRILTGSITDPSQTRLASKTITHSDP
jgi:hypothetical protein